MACDLASISQRSAVMAVRNNGALDGDRMVQLKATWGVMNGVSSFRARREDETGHKQPHNKKNGSPSTDGFLGYFFFAPTIDGAEITGFFRSVLHFGALLIVVDPFQDIVCVCVCVCVFLGFHQQWIGRILGDFSQILPKGKNPAWNSRG